MKKKQQGGVYITEFETITELVHFIETNEPYENFLNRENGCYSLSGSYEFTKTNNFEEAKDLLLHGWEHGTKEIKKQVDVKQTGISTKQKNVYDIVGYQCSVPRYLQGIPTNMINSKPVLQKNKVITINKMANYGYNVDNKTIIKESVKVLQLVNRLEKQGYRVNLNVIFGTYKKNQVITKVRVKNASQRLNIKQVAFPLIHPSMLRRIIFAVWERSKECSYRGFELDYGRVMDIGTIKQYLNKNEYLIPSVLEEQEITDIEQYKIN